MRYITRITDTVKRRPKEVVAVLAAAAVFFGAAAGVMLLHGEESSDVTETGQTVMTAPLSGSYAVLNRNIVSQKGSSETGSVSGTTAQQTTVAGTVKKVKTKKLKGSSTSTSPTGEKADRAVLSGSGSSGQESATYHYSKAASIYGKKYDVTMTIESISNQGESSSLYVGSNSPEITIAPTVKTSDKGDEIADLAEKYASHDPKYRYVLGGRELSTTTGGIDCAHFVGRVYKDCGVDITSNGADANVKSLRTVLKDDIVASYSEGNPIRLSDMKRGDIIIFFSNGSDSHTAIYIGDGKIAHAGDPSLGVTVTDLQYNESTGVAGYNGKTIQYIIRPDTKTTKTTAGSVKMQAVIRVTDPDTGLPVSLSDAKIQIWNGVRKGSYEFYDLKTDEESDTIEGVQSSSKNDPITNYYKSVSFSGDTLVDASDSGAGVLRLTMSGDAAEKLSWKISIE